MSLKQFAGSYWELSEWYDLRWIKSKNNRSSTESLVGKRIIFSDFHKKFQTCLSTKVLYDRFGPAGDPRGAGIGTPEAIKLVWSCHREIIYDYGPVPTKWEIPPST